MSLPVLEELMQVIAKKCYLPAKSFQSKPPKLFLIFKVIQAVEESAHTAFLASWCARARFSLLPKNCKSVTKSARVRWQGRRNRHDLTVVIVLKKRNAPMKCIYVSCVSLLSTNQVNETIPSNRLT